MDRSKPFWTLFFGAVLLLAFGFRTPFLQAGTIASCPLFPADNVWNTPIDVLPVDAHSSAYIGSIGADGSLHPDFGSGTWSGEPIGIPYNVVPGTQAKVVVAFDYDDQSDPGPYPIPPDPLIEGGPDSDGDRHLLIIDKDACQLYELYSAYPEADGTWSAGSGAIFDLRSNNLRPQGWTSADAAGLPILPGLLRYDEVASGSIDHAIRFTAPHTRNSHLWPARHDASSLSDLSYPPMGQRFRLKADFDLSGFSPQVQVILKALKRYGMILADNGSAWFLSGVPDSRWDNDTLVSELARVHGSDFEAIDESALMVDADSAQVRSRPSSFNADPPAQTTKLIFIHHSCGQNWLADGNGGLGIALRDNHYFVSDTNYGWGPDSIGDRTDIGQWWDWFRGSNRATILSALYQESARHSSYSRLAADPGGENRIIMFKSCFPNSNLGGHPDDPPTTGDNPLRGQSSSSSYHTVANAKGIYNDLLTYFASRQDKLFVVITAPPLVASDTTIEAAANARAFNNWLVTDWLKNYPYHNVAVFDFYSILTSNGGNTHLNDLGSATGNHHRYRNAAIEHLQTVAYDMAAYASSSGDSHPTAAGNLKATGEFPPLLNIYYHCWQGDGGCPAGAVKPTADFSADPRSGLAPLDVSFTDQSSGTIDSRQWDFGDGSSGSGANPEHTYRCAGTFKVSLTVTGPGGSDTMVKKRYLHVQLPAAVGRTTLSSDWTWTELSRTVSDPVVIVGPPTDHDSQPGVIRLKDVSATGFFARFQEWLYLDGTHGQEKAPYLVFSKGRYCLKNGALIEAGTFDLDGVRHWGSVSFTENFPGVPHLLLTIQTDNGSDPVTVRARNVTATGFEAALFEQENRSDGHLGERIGYLAIYSSQPSGRLELSQASLPYLLQRPKVDERFTPVLSESLRLEEEQSRDSETDHIDETLDVLALGPNLFAQDVTSMGADTIALRQLMPEYTQAMEWGTVDGLDHQWLQIPLAKTYTQPVVIAKPVSSRGSDPGVVRIRRLANDSFAVRFQEWGDTDGWHTTERLFYLVAEQGKQDLGPLRVEAGRLDTAKLLGQGWQTVNFAEAFTASPAVFGAVETAAGTDAVITRIRHVLSTGFEITMDEEEGKRDGHVAETLGWIAVSRGQGHTSDHRPVKVMTADASSLMASVSFGTSFAGRFPAVVGDIMSIVGSDPCVLRCREPGTASIELGLQEETSQDSETSHVTETVALFIAP